MFNTKDIELVLVGSSPVALTTAVDSTPATLNSGEIGLFTPNGVRILGANAAAQSKFKFALNDAGNIIVSDVIDKATITQLVPKVGSADVEQVDYIGFNGTSGDIAEIADNNYIVTVYIEELYTATKDNKYNKHFRANTGTTADKHDVVQQLSRDAIRNLGLGARDPNPVFKAEIVSADAGTALNVAVTDLTFVNNSKYVTLTGAATGIVVGQFIRVGLTVTSPIYKVVAINGLVLTLDTVYQGTTQTLLDTACQAVTASNFEAAAVGLKLTGIPIPFRLDRVGKQRFAKNIWNIGMSEFGTTLYTQAQGATRGVNATPSVAELEYFAQGFEFGDNKYEIDNGRPILYSNRQLVSGAYPFYNSITLRFEDRLFGAWKHDVSPKQLTIFTPSTDPAFMSTATNGLRAVLATMTGVAVPNP